MADKKQVIYDLERCTCHVPDACRDCSHDKGAVGFGRIGCMEALMEDALAILKEYDAVEPIPPTDESDLWKCGNCNHQLFRCTHQRYCEMCGKAVKWICLQN